MQRKRLISVLVGAGASCALSAALLVGSTGAGFSGGQVFFQNSSIRSIDDAPNGGGVISKIPVGRGGRIRDIEVAVRINHSFDADLNIYLVSPKGKFVELSTDNGGSGNNYGAGSLSCRGSLTRFDDEAGRRIQGGNAPFLGRFRPQTPLRALDGDSINGTWRLMVFDDDSGSTGAVGCFFLAALIR